MLVFIDESGDAGFKLDKGSTPIFVAAMVIFATAEDAARTAEAIENSRARQLHKPEFKFSKCSDDIRDEFCRTVARCPFSIRAIAVRKEVIYSPRLKADKERFYEYFVKQMMAWDGGMLRDARVIIDGSGDRSFRRDLNSALRRRMAEGAIRDVRFKDSHRDVLVQLADMCAGAIARSYRKDRHTPHRLADAARPHQRYLGLRLTNRKGRHEGRPDRRGPTSYSRRNRARTPYGDSSACRGDFAPSIWLNRDKMSRTRSRFDADLQIRSARSPAPSAYPTAAKCGCGCCHLCLRTGPLR